MLSAARRCFSLYSHPLALLAMVLITGVGCRPEIGDDCVSSADCSAQGDRLCDSSQPDGYCTIFGCEPDDCPEGSVCIGFGLELDPACENVSSTDPRWPRFERTFCMAACEETSDCRDGYVCSAPSDRRGITIDRENEDAASSVCFVASDATFESPADPPDACSTE